MVPTVDRSADDEIERTAVLPGGRAAGDLQELLCCQVELAEQQQDGLAEGHPASRHVVWESGRFRPLVAGTPNVLPKCRQCTQTDAAP